MSCRTYENYLKHRKKGVTKRNRYCYILTALLASMYVRQQQKVPVIIDDDDNDDFQQPRDKGTTKRKRNKALVGLYFCRAYCAREDETSIFG